MIVCNALKRPLVSVVTSAYRESPDVFVAAIDSILAQSHENIELLIALDDPDNHTLKSLIDSYAVNDARVIPVWNERNVGLPESLNRLISLASGDYICRMDADDIALPARIERQLKFLVDNNLQLVGGMVDVIDEKGSFLYSVDSIPSESNKIRRALRWNNCVPHPTWLGEASLFRQSYRLIPYCEDYDFLLRASLSGARIGNVNEKVLMYRQTSVSLSRSNLLKQFLYQRYLSKCYSSGHVADVCGATSYVQSKFNGKSSKAYIHANQLFNNALELIHNGRYMKGLLMLGQCALSSNLYFEKMIRLCLAAIA